jgi:hypothetical protein
MYDSSVGRWLEQDPLGLSAGPNPYEYVGDDPANATDPSGLQKVVGSGGIYDVPVNPPIPRIPITDYVLSQNQGPYKIVPAQLKEGTIREASFLQFNPDGNLQDAFDEAPRQPIPGEQRWIVPLYAGRKLYFRKSEAPGRRAQGRIVQADTFWVYIGGSGGTGGVPNRTQKTLELESGMRLLFEGVRDTGEIGGRFIQVVDSTYKPVAPEVVIIVHYVYQQPRTGCIKIPGPQGIIPGGRVKPKPPTEFP